MIQSMTGFGKVDVAIGNKTYAVSLKSVNSKTADLNIKLPSAFREKENYVRSFLNASVGRGKVDLYVSYDSGSDENSVFINESLLKTYLAKFMKISEGLNLSDDKLFSMATRMPNVFVQGKEEVDEKEWLLLEKAIHQAIAELVEFRKQEGNVLEKDLLGRLKMIRKLTEEIKPHEEVRTIQIKERLNKQLEQALSAEQINRDRFEQEMIYFFEKLDITEEKVRLNAHCNLFEETMKSEESQGKKLGFIAQEMGREINTIGSKANHAEIQRIVVEMKDELEKIKEQLFNIL